MNIMIIGSGGREHALVNAIARSPLCSRIYAAPGNPGIAEKAELVAIPVTEVEHLVAFADNHEVDFVVVGPELPLTLGLVDALTKRGILAFGPTKAAAQLEESKAFTKALCLECGIPTASAAVFTDADAARQYLAGQSLPIVIKADGLAAGKGVTIARTTAEAQAAIVAALEEGRFGEAGATVVIEEFLEGEELSLFALCDGTRAVLFGSAQDHKAAFDGDQGPNTGGMGAYSPAPVATPALEAEAMHRIVEPTCRAMADRGMPFNGILFAGLMVTSHGPKLIEYNVRFGDPECEVLLARYDGDILPLLMACAGGNMGRLKPTLGDNAAICVVIAANGYPGEYRTGTPIAGLAAAAQVPGVAVLQAGTGAIDGHLVADGGRVLAVTATAATLAEARDRAYRAVDLVEWEDGFCRRDIGWRALEHTN